MEPQHYRKQFGKKKKRKRKQRVILFAFGGNGNFFVLTCVEEVTAQLKLNANRMDPLPLGRKYK